MATSDLNVTVRTPAGAAENRLDEENHQPARHRRMARQTLSARRHLGRPRRQFRALFGACRASQLCLFDDSGRREIQRIDLPERTEQVWHCYLPEARPGMLYGYRVYGPYQPELGHRFNPHKLLIDPYAREISGALRWSDAHYGYAIGHKREDLSFDRRESARGMPKCRVVDSAFSWGDDRRPQVPWRDTVIYEMHVRGYTKLHPQVPPVLRGTFAGMSCPPVIDHLKRLGVTTIELLPIHAFVDDRTLVERGLRNYWGYNSIGFFAPEQRYCASDCAAEFKTMVKALHSAGLEVVLDVVYNHTAEGNQHGPTLSFRGIDNAVYYRLNPDEPRSYLDYTGCGNSLNMLHPRVLQLVTDSLRYWVEEMHVDGFRFDLATTLGREAHGYDPSGVVPRHPAPGPGAVAGEADRGTVGPRRRAATRSEFSGRLARVERPVSRRDARVLERRRRADRRFRAAAHGLQRHLRAQRPRALRHGEFRDRARRLHAARSREL